MVNTLNYRLSHLGWSYFTLGEFHYSGANYVVLENIYISFRENVFFFLDTLPPPLPIKLHVFKVGTHKETSPQLIPATSPIV